jgi:hypothetical protein
MSRNTTQQTNQMPNETLQEIGDALSRLTGRKAGAEVSLLDETFDAVQKSCLALLMVGHFEAAHRNKTSLVPEIEEMVAHSVQNALKIPLSQAKEELDGNIATIRGSIETEHAKNLDVLKSFAPPLNKLIIAFAKMPFPGQIAEISRRLSDTRSHLEYAIDRLKDPTGAAYKEWLNLHNSSPSSYDLIQSIRIVLQQEGTSSPSRAEASKSGVHVSLGHDPLATAELVGPLFRRRVPAKSSPVVSGATLAGPSTSEPVVSPISAVHSKEEGVEVLVEEPSGRDMVMMVVSDYQLDPSLFVEHLNTTSDEKLGLLADRLMTLQGRYSQLLKEKKVFTQAFALSDASSTFLRIHVQALLEEGEFSDILTALDEPASRNLNSNIETFATLLQTSSEVLGERVASRFVELSETSFLLANMNAGLISQAVKDLSAEDRQTLSHTEIAGTAAERFVMKIPEMSFSKRENALAYLQNVATLSRLSVDFFALVNVRTGDSAEVARGVALMTKNLENPERNISALISELIKWNTFLTGDYHTPPPAMDVQPEVSLHLGEKQLRDAIGHAYSQERVKALLELIQKLSRGAAGQRVAEQAVSAQYKGRVSNYTSKEFADLIRGLIICNVLKRAERDSNALSMNPYQLMETSVSEFLKELLGYQGNGR